MTTNDNDDGERDEDPVAEAIQNLVYVYEQVVTDEELELRWRDYNDRRLHSAGLGAALIAAERRHAIEECGFDAEHDAHHTPQQLERAARAYLEDSRKLWPFSDGFKQGLSYRRRLIIAGQFLAAALDRLAVTGLHPTTDQLGR